MTLGELAKVAGDEMQPFMSQARFRQSVSLAHRLARRIGPLGRTRLAASPQDRHTQVFA